MAKFSIVVPIYNVEKYLDKCITSIIEQTYKDFELILVDDGSPDNSPKICDEYAQSDERIKVIHKQNGGLVSARKAGTDISVGDYIVCVDGDDWVEKNCLESFADVLEKADIDVLCCEYYTADENTKSHINTSLKEGLYKSEDIEKYIYPCIIEDVNGKYFSNNLWAKAIKRELYIKYQSLVDNKICIGEDAAVTKPCIYAADSLYILKKPLYYYRYNPSSVTKGGKAFNWYEPKLRGEHFEKTIDMDAFDFKEQNYRMIVHALFNAAESQFNRKEKYSVIAKEIKENLNDEYYRNAIKNCKFKGKKAKLALFALKYKVICLIYLFNKIKKF